MKTRHKQPQKQIKNLGELRLAKKKIKRDILIIEERQENSTVGKAINMFTSHKFNQDFASSKIEESLNWLGKKASNRFPLNGVTQLVISGLIVLAAPIITSKVQEFIKNKF